MSTTIKLACSFVCAALLCGPLAFGQSFEEYKKQSQNKFNAYRQQQQEVLNQYRNKINKEFSDRLNRPWQLHPSSPAKTNPIKEIPDIPIPPVPENQSSNTENRYTSIRVQPQRVETPADELPPLEQETPEGVQTVHFTFLGEKCSLRIGRGVRVTLNSTDEAVISQAWKKMACPEYNILAADFQHAREKMGLCDWATLNFAEEASSCINGSKTSAEAILLQVWLLSQSGLQAVMAVDENGKLRMLIATDKQLFNYPAFIKDGQVYYVVDGKPIRKAGLQPCRFPGSRPFQMTFMDPSAAQDKPVYGKHGIVDESRIQFYSLYPDYCDEGAPLSSFYYHAMVPLSQSAKENLYPKLRQRIGGKGKVEAAGILLEYIQKEYAYRADDAVWHRERYFYAEETLYYEYSDCEDRAILYSWLVRDLLGLKAALIYYPGHLAAAVYFPERVSGDAALIEGKRYIICDPTYIGAGIGVEMTTVDKTKARVIPL